MPACAGTGHRQRRRIALNAQQPRSAVMIAATHSGAGKTTATGVLLRGLVDRGLDVRSFKIGPDFIDPGYHREITGVPAINLDLPMMGPDGVRESFGHWSTGADVAVIESMGALYDGVDGTGSGSPAAVAKLLDVSVLIVLDVWGMTRTAGALLDGLTGFDPQVRIIGGLLNRVGSPAHAQMITDALPNHTIVGAIGRDTDLEVAERHLGLLTAEENPDRSVRARAHSRAAAELDLDRLLQSAPTPPAAGTPTRSETVELTDGAGTPADAAPRARLAIARDEAFCFYYEENLLALQRAGFELVPFSVLGDDQLPPAVDAVYLGGGYPESFGDRLAHQDRLAAELRQRAERGMPVYAECGGLMYLARSLTNFDGTRHSMAGLLGIDVAMDREFLAIRYVEVDTLNPSPLGPAGTTVRGQEFHQSRITAADIEPNLYRVSTSAGDQFDAGFQVSSVVGSYIHLHFARHPDLPGALLDAALTARR